MGDMLNLSIFHLQNNKLTGSIPSSLGNLTKLTDFRVSFNSLNGTIPEFFASLGPFTTFEVNRNRFTGAIPAGLAAVSGNFAFARNFFSGCILSTEVTPPCNGGFNAYMCGCDLPVCGLPICDLSCNAPLPVSTAFCSNGTWLVPDALVIEGDTEVLVTRPINIKGDLTILAPTVVISVTLADLQNLSVPIFNISGCAAFDGTLVVNLTSGSSAPINASTEVLLATFQSGYCNGVPTGFKTVVAVRDDAPCKEVAVSSNYQAKSLSLAFGEADTSCIQTDSSPGAPAVNGGDGQAPIPLTIVASCIAAGVVLLVVALVGLIFCCRHRLVPAHRMARRLRHSRQTFANANAIT